MLARQSKARQQVGSYTDCVKTTALDNTALKTGEKCSFRTPRLRFFACFCLVLSSLVTFSHSLHGICGSELAREWNTRIWADRLRGARLGRWPCRDQARRVQMGFCSVRNKSLPAKAGPTGIRIVGPALAGRGCDAFTAPYGSLPGPACRALACRLRRSNRRCCAAGARGHESCRRFSRRS